MATVTMADASVYECAYEGRPWPGTAYITLLGKNLIEAAVILSDTDKTQTMVIDDAGIIDRLEGYTKLSALVAFGGDARAIMEVPSDG